MKFDFDRIIDRSSTHALKWQKYEGREILPMWVADMDFGAPPAVQEAIIARADHEIFGYTQVPSALNDRVVERMHSLYSWTIRPESILWLPGVVTGLNIACRAFAGPSRTIVTTTPVYPPFLSAPANQNKQLAAVPMIDINRRFCLDFDRIEAEFKKGAGLFMLCSPANPCGTVFTREELAHLVSLCRTYQVILCSDEIHADFVLNPDLIHLPAAAVSRTAEQLTVTLMAPSKTYNIPGLGASFAIIPDPDLRKEFRAGCRGVVPEVNIMGLVAAQAVYTHADEWLSQLIEYLRTNRDLVFERVNRMPGCRLYSIDATYLAWIDVSKTGLNDPVAFFEQAGVGLSDGAFFGQNGFVRLNFGCPRSLLKEGLDRMENALNLLFS